MLHLATHGILNDASPMYSHLVLSAEGGSGEEDGLLEAWEVIDLDLEADLAVLSACETGRGRVGAGEGMIGLSWAFFVAGCPTTVVSQWQVESASTTELMLAFHRNLMKGESKAQALRSAALKLLGDRRYRHPFYWAGFVVIGEDAPIAGSLATTGRDDAAHPAVGAEAPHSGSPPAGPEAPARHPRAAPPPR